MPRTKSVTQPPKQDSKGHALTVCVHSTPRARKTPPLSIGSDTNHGVYRQSMDNDIVQIMHSLHRRTSALECKLGNHGVFSVRPIIDQTEMVLTALDKIQNYEKTISTYVARFNQIKAMCQQPSPDWLVIISSILDILAGEDVEKAKRDEELIYVINRNLDALDVMQELSEVETKRIKSDSWDPLSAQATFIGVSLTDAANDVRHVLQMAVNYKKTIEGVSIKFGLLKGKIKDINFWDIPTLLRTSIEIINILQEEDIAKKQREDNLLQAMKTISLSFESVGDAIVKLKNETRRAKGLSNEVHIEAHLDEPFSLALGTFKDVLQGIEAVINYQKTINDICLRCYAFTDQLNQLASVNDWREIIPCLLRLIHILKEEDETKIQRDNELITDLEKQNKAVKKLTDDLYRIGYKIV